MSMQIDLNAWTYTIFSGKTYDTLSNEMFGNLFLEPWRMRVNKNREWKNKSEWIQIWTNRKGCDILSIWYQVEIEI